MKRCSHCNKKKLLTEFRKRGKYLRSWCKKCEMVYWKKWRKKWIEKNPWYKTYYNITSRCKYVACLSYKKRGIKCLITPGELKYLWFRDKAWLLNHASIDRIDNDGHYTVDNCRYIEYIDNCRQGGLIAQQKRRNLNK